MLKYKAEQYVDKLNMYLIEQGMGDMPQANATIYIQELDRLWHELTEEDIKHVEEILTQRRLQNWLGGYSSPTLGKVDEVTEVGKSHFPRSENIE